MEQKIFLTANTFFGRTKALQFRHNFNSVEQMNDYIVEKWNLTVDVDDIVYHLGYFAHDPYIANEIIDDLNGNIIFLNNQTDNTVDGIIKIYESIDIVPPICEVFSKKSILSYYPLQTWPNMEDTYHFYGDATIKTELVQYPNRMNISFDYWKKPINIDECIDFIKEFKNQSLT